MDIDDYMKEMVEPAFLDFHRNPNSIRHAYLACLMLTHVADYAAPSDDEVKLTRDEWIKLSRPFAVVDEVAQYLKHGARRWVKQAKSKTPDALLITHAIGLENGGLKVGDLHNLYFQVRDALDFVRAQIARNSQAN